MNPRSLSILLFLLCVCVCVCDMCVLVAQSFSTLCDSMDCSPTVSSVHEILHAKVLEWVAISFSRGSSQPKDWAQVSCIAGRFFTNWINRETPLFLLSRCNIKSFCLPCSSSSASVQSLQLLSHVKLLRPTDCTTPGFPVHHQLPEIAQTHVHHSMVMPSIHLILYCPHLLQNSIFPCIRVFFNGSVFHIWWLKLSIKQNFWGSFTQLMLDWLVD